MLQNFNHIIFMMASAVKCRQLLHPGTIIALGIIAVVSVVAQVLILEEHGYGYWSLQRQPNSAAFKPSTVQALIYAYCAFLTWPIFTLFNYFRAVFNGPGFVPLGWQPRYPEYRQYLQFCDNCLGYKPPRAHHCRTCKRCVHKMDHHCPWINACVGVRNQATFAYFLLFAPIGCSHALCYLIPFIYRLIFAHWYHKNNYELFVQLTRYPVWFIISTFLSTGLAFGVIFALCFLLAIQLRQALRNRTGIEDFIVKKAAMIRQKQEEDICNGLFQTGAEIYPHFTFPYDLSWKRNLAEIFLKNDFQDDDDQFINWPVKDGCSPFDLTVEQMRQKRAKRDSATSFEVTRRYHGHWCPVFSYGLRTAFPPPMFNEHRLEVQPGEIVQATRQRGAWIYGELVYSPSGFGPEEGRRRRGWLPKASARLISDDQAKLMNNHNSVIIRNKFE